MRIAIIGTGGMARSHADAYASIDDVEIVAGVDTNTANLTGFREKFDVPHGFGSVEDLISWGNFDAVSNVTPDPFHISTTLPLLAAKKHVLCEKPLATTEADAKRMSDAAAEAGVINMVNLTYRNVPAVMAAAEMVARGDIGDVRHFEASYLQSWLTQPAWGDWRTHDQWLWRLSSEHGSLGVLGDVGVHILDFATLVAGASAKEVSCRLTTFDKAPGGRIGQYKLDANDSATLQISLNNGAVGVVHATRMASGHINDLRLRVYGTKGGLDARFENSQSKLYACLEPDLETATWSEVETPDVTTNYRRFVEAIQSNAQALPDFARGAQLQSALDRAVQSDAQNGVSLEV